MPPLVAFPLVLPMGWTESPLYFCAFTETGSDLANSLLQRNLRYPHHRLENLTGEGDFGPNPERGHDLLPLRRPLRSHRSLLSRRPIAYVDVFVDNFLGLGQGHPSNPLANQRCTLVTAIDDIF
jgi:hypothetical protein